MINRHKLHTAFANAGATTQRPKSIDDARPSMVVTVLADEGATRVMEWWPDRECTELAFWMLGKMGDDGGRLWNMRMDVEGFYWGGLDHRRDTFKGIPITEVVTKMFIETFGLR